MTSTPIRLAAAATAAVVLAGLTQLPTTAAPSDGSTPQISLAGDGAPGLSDQDRRGTAQPLAAQLTAARSLGATVRWNRFGTPASVSPASGTLGAASGDPVAAARSWLQGHTDLLGISADQVRSLELVSSQQLAGSDARAVLFRQSFGTDAPTPAMGSMVTVGVGDGAVQYVSSSLVRAQGGVPAATIGPRDAWLRAAADVGKDVAAGDLSALRVERGWSRFDVRGLAQEQMSRLRSVALADGTVRPVFEVNVIDVQGASASAYTSLVDAVTGDVLVRRDQVDHSNDAFQFQGTVTATDCGPKHAFEIEDDLTKRITATAGTALTTNDILIKLFDPAGKLLTTADTGTSPEVATYAAASIPKGIYSVQICPFAEPTAPFIGPDAYAAGVVTSDTDTPSADTGTKPRWRYTTANPELNWSPTHTPTNFVIGCWTSTPDCNTPTGPFKNVADLGAWDWNVEAGVPTFTTIGNNANTHEAWLSPLTPGGTARAPISPTREYTTEFTDAWNNARCNPANFAQPDGNDIDASVTNLFVAHNRMHDYSYYLGFTEANYNLQQSNAGRNEDPTRARDPEVGNAQAGAVTGGAPSYLGRDNANQIALQDGVPGITNQYLFQPIAGAFYSPCTDGSMDMSIVGHEYTHAISNRMIGGPDEGISSEQGGAMGESWGDLVAAEYMTSHGYATGTNPWAVGPYATGNKTVGIRDYAINANPLNYSDYGFDSTGDEVHADGEIWNGTMWSVREALRKAYDAQYPSSDKALQLRCAQATATSSPLAADKCPGNRRWVQLMFDSLLLQQGATSMLDARDAMLAADRMRFGGDNQKILWDAFARRGMGSNAKTPNADSGDTVAGFISPRTASGAVTFQAPAGVKGTVYVGRYEARVTPVGDTDPDTARSSRVVFAPGTYNVLFRAPGRGIVKTTMSVASGVSKTLAFDAPPNLASRSNGAKVIGASAGSLNADALIDDTEATNWAGVTEAGQSVDGVRPFVAVDLAGSAPRTITRVNVSAMLRPGDADPNDPTGGVPLVADPDAGSRFTALRRFAIEVCTTSCASGSASWKRIYTSAADAFPAVAPRPVAPNLNLRSFDIPDTTAAAVRLVALESQCTGTAAYAGEQDEDPANDTDCKAASDRDESVRAAELQVF